MNTSDVITNYVQNNILMAPLKELNDRLIAEIAKLRKEVAKIKSKNAELETERDKIKARYEAEIAELKGENEKLHQIIEESTKRELRSVTTEAENTELKSRLCLRSRVREARLAVLEQGSAVDGQSQNDKERLSGVTVLTDITDSVVNQLNSADAKSSGKRETVAFLEEVNKKKVSDGIRQRKQENKPCDQLPLGEIIPTSLTINNLTKISAGGPCQNNHRKKCAENIV